MSGYFESLALRAAGLAPTGWPRVAPRALPRLTEATGASPDEEPATGRPTGGVPPIPRAPADARDRTRARESAGVEPPALAPALPPAAGDTAGRPAWPAPGRRVVTIEPPERPVHEAPRGTSTGGPGQASVVPRDRGVMEAPAPRVLAPSPVATGPGRLLSRVAPSPNAVDAEVSARGPTIVPAPLDVGRPDPRQGTPSPAPAGDAADLPGGRARPPVSLTIGRIEVTVEPPSPAAATPPERSRGFAAYARARRGHLR